MPAADLRSAPGVPPGRMDGGAAPPAEDFHLSRALEHEVARLVTHPVHEVERLREEAREGAWGTTLAIVLAGITIWVALLVAVVLVLVLVVSDASG